MGQLARDTSLDVRTITVIDSDEDALRLLHQQFDALFGRLVSVSFETDAAQAWERLRQTPSDLVVIGINLSPMGGLGLFNKLKASVQYAMTPIILMCKPGEAPDFNFVREFPLASKLMKPISRAALLSTIKSAQSEQAWYREQSERVRKLIEDAWVNAEEISKHVAHVFATSPSPVPLCLLIARQLTNYGMNQEAEMIYRKIVDFDNQNLQALAGLGRLLYLRSSISEAAVYLRMANHLSPNNVERLCTLGEFDLAAFDVDGAKENFQKAMTIDPTSEKAQAGNLIAENMAEFVSQYAQIAQQTSFASICNTIGVYLVRSGDIQRGIEQYKAAMCFLRDDETKGRVAFNIGLGFLKWQKPDEALRWFEQALHASRGSQSKASRYLQLARAGLLQSNDDGEIVIEATVDSDGQKSFEEFSLYE